MAYIQERGSFWRAEVRRKGYKPVYRTFDTQKQAQQWARRVEAEMDAGSFVDRTEAEQTTLREALECQSACKFDQGKMVIFSLISCAV